MIPNPEPVPPKLLAWAANRGGTPAAPTTERPTYAGQRDVAARARRVLAGDLPPPEDLLAAADAIHNPDWGWDDYNRALMLCWAASGGQAHGLAAAHTIAAKSRKYRPEDVEARWAHYFRSPPLELGFGTLVLLARESVPGWAPPSRMSREASPEQLQQPPAESSVTVNLGKTNGVHANPALLPAVLGEAISGNPLIELNKRYAAIGDVGGKCLVMSWVGSKVSSGVKIPSFQSFRSFSERYGNQYVMVKREGKNGETVEEAKQLGPYWLKWTGRKSYEGIDLVPGGESVLPGNVLNLWDGFGVEPKAGSWDRTRAHVCEVLAAGDAAAAQYILRYAAWAVQHPADRAEVALVLRGGKGSGKGTFANALVKVFGTHGLHIYSSKHLVGAFNGHLRNCVMLFADEAFWAGDKQGESVLKGMLTEPTLVIEQKGVDAAAWPNCLHVIMAANAEWVVPASHDERRYACFNIADSRIGDFGYFARLQEELANGGLGAMLWDLQRMELGGWHPRKILQTDALREQKARSLDPRLEWWEALLQLGVLPHWHGDATLVASQAIIGHARDHSSRLRDVSATAVGRFLGEMGCEGFHRTQGNFWRFTPLNEARKAWETRYGAWVWKTDLTDWEARKPSNPSNASQHSMRK